MNDSLTTPATIDKLASALSKAQGEFKAVQKTGKNPHLRNEYATLDDIIGMIRAPLAKYGLSFVQLLGTDGTGVTTLRTVLLHESGQQLESTVAIEISADQRGINAMQSLGSAITYMKRYSLSAMLGIAADADTDAEGSGSAGPKAPAKAASSPVPAPDTKAASGNGTATTPKPLARRPQDLFTLVNGRLTVPYSNVHHLLSALKQELGDGWSWPPFKDADGWNAAYMAALRHGKAKEKPDTPAPDDVPDAEPLTGDELAEWFESQ